MSSTEDLVTVVEAPIGSIGKAPSEKDCEENSEIGSDVDDNDSQAGPQLAGSLEDSLEDMSPSDHDDDDRDDNFDEDEDDEECDGQEEEGKDGSNAHGDAQKTLESYSSGDDHLDEADDQLDTGDHGDDSASNSCIENSPALESEPSHDSDVEENGHHSSEAESNHPQVIRKEQRTFSSAGRGGGRGGRGGGRGGFSSRTDPSQTGKVNRPPFFNRPPLSMPGNALSPIEGPSLTVNNWGFRSNLIDQNGNFQRATTDLKNYIASYRLSQYCFFFDLINGRYPQFVRTLSNNMEIWRMSFNIYSSGFGDFIAHLGEIHAFYQMEFVGNELRWVYKDFNFYPNRLPLGFRISNFLIADIHSRFVKFICLRDTVMKQFPYVDIQHNVVIGPKFRFNLQNMMKRLKQVKVVNNNANASSKAVARAPTGFITSSDNEHLSSDNDELPTAGNYVPQQVDRRLPPRNFVPHKDRFLARAPAYGGESFIGQFSQRGRRDGGPPMTAHRVFNPSRPRQSNNR